MQKNRPQNYRKVADNAGVIQKGLMKIYSNADGSLPDISHLEVRRRSRWRTILFGAAIVSTLLAGIAWAGFLVFGPGNIGNTTSVWLELTGPQSIASGDEVTYVLNYKNVDKVDLSDVEIIFRYPDHFTFSTADPAPTNNFNSSWKIGSLARGQSGRIEIHGRLIGEVGSIQTFNVTAQFRPENFSSLFKESAVYNSQVTSSIIELTVVGPTQSFSEKKVQYKIAYHNNSDQDLSNIKIKLQYTNQFIFQEATPPGESLENNALVQYREWLIPLLVKQGSGEIIVTGGFTPDDQSTSANITVQIGFVGETEEDFSLQQERIVTTEIIRPNLVLNLIINGSSQNQPINFDQELTYSIVYKNLGQRDLNNVVISATLNGDIVDWLTLEDQHDGKRSGNTIVWTKDQISELDIVRPLAEGTINFMVKTRDGSALATGTILSLISKAGAAMASVSDLDAVGVTVSSNEIQNNINTDIQLVSAGRYFDDDNIPVGTGPLPPVVGQRTSFRIFWSLANSLHEVGDVVVSTVLPNGITWDNKFLAKTGSISYSSKTRTVTWKIDKIAPNQGLNDLAIWFDVSVVPTKQQVRKLLILTDQTTLTALDKVTDAVISKTAGAITSNLDDDPIGGGRGLVIDISQ